MLSFVEKEEINNIVNKNISNARTMDAPSYSIKKGINNDADSELNKFYSMVTEICEEIGKKIHPKSTGPKNCAVPRKRGRPLGSTKSPVPKSPRLATIAENDSPITSWGSANAVDENGAAPNKITGEKKILKNIQNDEEHDFYYKVRVNYDHYVVDEKSLEVLIEDGFVVVKGSYKVESQDGFVYRPFSYYKKFPDNIDIENMSAELDDQGFIHITGKKSSQNYAPH